MMPMNQQDTHMIRKGLSRRGFLNVTATAAGGMMISLPLSGCMNPEDVPEGEAAELSPLVRIEPDNRIILGVGKPEVGQGVHTSMPMLIAEELDVAWDQVEVIPLPVGLARGEDGAGFRWKYGSQDAGGSTSVWNMWSFMREVGAEARRRLVLAAAREWGVEPAACTTENGRIIHSTTGRELTYGQVAAHAAEIEVPEGEAPLKGKDDFRIIGSSQPMVHVDRIVTGNMEFGIDAELPGMKHAVVQRAPRLNAKLVSYDAEAALAIPGVRQVVTIEGPGEMGDFNFQPIADGVAVVADTIWAAMKGRDALSIEWTDGPMKGVSSADLAARADAMMQSEGQVLRDDGDAEAAFAAAERILEAAYDVPLVSHATMEPQSCIAHVREDSVDLIVPTQDSSDSVISTMERTNIPLDRINARVTRTGGGFGRRLDDDYVPEAVEVSRAIGGPVRVHWTREDDMRNDFYRPSARHRLRAGLDADGNIIAWEHKLATPGRYFRRGVPPDEIYIPEYWLDDFPAQFIPNMKVEYHFLETAIPTGPWRAPGHTANAFAVQAFLDEIAEATGRDKLDMRLAMLGEPREVPYAQHGGPVFDTGRMANVLRIAAERGGWGESLPEGRGRGIAGHFTFGTYVAHVVDVTVRDGELRVDKVTSAVDCGIPVNRNGVHAQMEGGINDALSTALYQEITIEDGAIVQGNFDTYRMMTIADSPRQIDIHIVDSQHDPKGMGEPPVPPLAPALVNAIHDATGRRIRKLPIANQLREA